MDPTGEPATDEVRRAHDTARKRTRNTQQRAARLLARQRAQRARRRRLVAAASAMALVVAALAVMVIVKLASTDDGGHAARSDAVVTGGPVARAMNVPAEVLDQVGKGQVLARPTAVPDQPALADAGKPLVVYIGGEYCPHCASQRWAVVVALSRFGTFSDLRLVDVAGGAQILSFHGSSYTSEHLSFQGVEIADSNGKPLDTLTAQQDRLMKTLDAPPYVPAESAGAIPFMDFANKYVILGATYDETVLQGRSAAQIAAALYAPKDPIAQGVLGSANMFTALICRLTQGKPERVCTGAAARAYEGQLQ